jgi:hypothetical protein
MMRVVGIAGAFHDARIIAELTPHFLDHLERCRTD